MAPQEVGEVMLFNRPEELHNGRPVEYWDDLVERSNGEGFM